MGLLWLLRESEACTASYGRPCKAAWGTELQRESVREGKWKEAMLSCDREGKVTISFCLLPLEESNRLSDPQKMNLPALLQHLGYNMLVLTLRLLVS